MKMHGKLYGVSHELRGVPHEQEYDSHEFLQLMSPATHQLECIS